MLFQSNLFRLISSRFTPTKQMKRSLCILLADPPIYLLRAYPAMPVLTLSTNQSTIQDNRPVYYTSLACRKKRIILQYLGLYFWMKTISSHLIIASSVPFTDVPTVPSDGRAKEYLVPTPTLPYTFPYHPLSSPIATLSLSYLIPSLPYPYPYHYHYPYPSLHPTLHYPSLHPYLTLTLPPLPSIL